MKIIGPSDYLVTPFNDLIYSFVGFLEVDLEEIKPNDEVESVFTVPLEYFLIHEPLKYEAYIIHEINEDFPYELIPKEKIMNGELVNTPFIFTFTKIM